MVQIFNSLSIVAFTLARRLCSSDIPCYFKYKETKAIYNTSKFFRRTLLDYISSLDKKNPEKSKEKNT